ncbi:hypothetical protein KEM54_000622 [Ascosphaera aggregata]|nr:hypothetical protein KEM54_000622 [Ascosphaera aggregata]
MASAVQSSSTPEDVSGLKKEDAATAGTTAVIPPQPSSRPKRPNYRDIHRFPLPIETHPLPPLIPHNPLSWATIAFTYISQLLSPPQRKKYTAYFDPLTSSVHVTDPSTIRALWEMGFFGKGSLSRSEPTWLEREKKRLGLVAGSTAEEVTRARRNERREMKLERARKEREAIEQQLRLEAERKAADEKDVSYSPSTKEPIAEVAVTEEIISVSSSGNQATSLAENATAAVSSEAVGATKAGTTQTAESSSSGRVVEKTVTVEQSAVEEDIDLQDQEHLQLSLDEVFFLVYGLGVLDVYNGPDIDSPSCWVVRSGVKFGVDYILYNRGPVFSHAEFAVVILPSYSDAYWLESEERRKHVAHRTEKSWWWLHCVNRVQAQVKKTLVLCYVEIPPPTMLDKLQRGEGKKHALDIGEQLKAYRVREFCIRRWVPNRTRD